MKECALGEIDFGRTPSNILVWQGFSPKKHYANAIILLIWSDWEGYHESRDAQGTPTQSHISPSTLVYEDYRKVYVELHEKGDSNSHGARLIY